LDDHIKISSPVIDRDQSEDIYDNRYKRRNLKSGGTDVGKGLKNRFPIRRWGVLTTPCTLNGLDTKPKAEPRDSALRV
jgi:hypothetical protein